MSTIVKQTNSHAQEDLENIQRARSSGKGVLTAPFKLVKSNRLGVILTYAVYKRELPLYVTSAERIQAAIGYDALYDSLKYLLQKVISILKSSF